MVSLYFNVFSSLSLSNLLPRVQLANLLNNQNQNSFLNRFGLQDTVTDLLNRVGFDQTFSIGNKIGIDRPDSLLNKVELGMNNVINLNQQSLLNSGQSGVGGLYGGNGPGQFTGSEGDISGVGTYGGGLGISGGGGGLLGTQGGWQGSAQGSFPIGGGGLGNRPAPPGAYPDAQYGGGGGGIPVDSGGGVVNNGQLYGNGAGQSGSTSGGGLLSGIFSQMGNRFGWGSSNKNDPKDFYKQSGGGMLHSWWMNQEENEEYWLQQSLKNALDDGRTADSSSDTVLKYLVESQIKKLVSSMLQHLDEAKARPEEQLKLNEAAQKELRKLTPEQIKRIAHDIVEREKAKLSKLNEQKTHHRGNLSEEDLKQLLVKVTKENDIKISEDEIAQLLQTMHKQTSKHHGDYAANTANKTIINDFVKQTNVKPEQNSLNLEDPSYSVGEISTSEVRPVVSNKTSDRLERTTPVAPSSAMSTVDNRDAAEGNKHPLYLSEQMRQNINELLQQLSGQSQETTSSTLVRSTVSLTTASTTATPTTSSTTTGKTSSVSNTTVEAAKDEEVKAFLQRLFGNSNDEALKPFRPQQLGHRTRGPSLQSDQELQSSSRKFGRNSALDLLRAKVLRRNSTIVGAKDNLLTTNSSDNHTTIYAHAANDKEEPKVLDGYKLDRKFAFNHFRAKVLNQNSTLIGVKRSNETLVSRNSPDSAKHAHTSDYKENSNDLITKKSSSVVKGNEHTAGRKQSKKRDLLLQPPPFPSRWFKRNLTKKFSLPSSN